MLLRLLRFVLFASYFSFIFRSIIIRKCIIFAFFVLLCVFTQIVFSQNQSFDSWVEELRQEAVLLGLSEQTLLVLDELEAPLERVLELDNSQPEFVQTFPDIYRCA